MRKATGNAEGRFQFDIYYQNRLGNAKNRLIYQQCTGSAQQGTCRRNNNV